MRTAVRRARGARRDALTTCANVDVDIPLGVLVVLTGVAGSGKSSLAQRLGGGRRDGVVTVDQAAIKRLAAEQPGDVHRPARSDPRTAFAKANGVKPALFSANSEGACPNCNGNGVIYTDLAMMAGVATSCARSARASGSRSSVLKYTASAASDISEVLAMAVVEAEAFFAERQGGANAGCARDPGAARRRWPRLPAASASRSPRSQAVSGSG